jgi:hypothetical protein
VIGDLKEKLKHQTKKSQKREKEDRIGKEA